jgi:urease accessory protein
LLLADGRLPTGGHAHSGGVEAAVTDGRIVDVDSLATFLTARLWSTGLTEAALAAATNGRGGSELEALDAEAEARIVAAPLRVVSRRLGRQLIRVAGRCWPHPVFAALVDPHQAVALGACGIAAGLTPEEVADLAVHHALTTPAQAAVRLLGLDPFAVAALTADLAVTAAEVAAVAVAAAPGPLEELPAPSAPLFEIAAVEHAGRDARLFAT